MKEWMKKRKSRGFTLVELLIVIVIIGILAGSLLLVMGSGTDKANATKVVSDLRTLKAAMLMFYSDNGDWPDAEDPLKKDGQLDKYLDRVPEIALGVYSITPTSVVFTKKDAAATGFASRLEDMAQGVGITPSGDVYSMVVRN